MTNLITSIATNVTARMMSSNSQDYAHKTLFQFIHRGVILQKHRPFCKKAFEAT